MSAPRSQSCVRLRSGFIHVLEKGERAMAQRDALLALRRWLNHRILGQEALVDRLLIALLSDGHLLVEGAPGLAKTRAIKDLALGVEGSFHRIQFTPDLLPSDVTGTDIFSPETGQFSFQEGPIFHNLVLADEINRAPAKVQSALLEAMAEGQVSVGRRSLELPELFLVMATQNPIEQEGTYPLPEAQLDRFLLNVLVAYPDAETEQRILSLVRAEAQALASQAPPAPLSQDDLFAARQAVLSLHMDPAVETYLVQLILATRNPALWGEDLARWIEYGASPRGTLALDRCARARAWLEGRDFVTPEDIQALVHDVLRHRVLVTFEAQAQGISTDHVLDELLARVPVA
jgi:MoxR-like ATPase